MAFDSLSALPTWPARLNAALAWRLFPPSCVLCGTAGKDVCLACVADTEASLDPACRQCALPLEQGKLASGLCGGCLRDAPDYDRSFAAAIYAPPFDQLLLDLKYRAQLTLAPVFAQLLAARLTTCRRQHMPGAELPDVLVPVPLSNIRLAGRGFNQALEIALPLGRKLGIPVRTAVLRYKHTDAQAALPFAQRRKNIRGAFVVRDHVAGLRVGVVDDVMTTGSTLAEMAHTLKQAGAREVVNLVVARTPKA